MEFQEVLLGGGEGLQMKNGMTREVHRVATIMNKPESPEYLTRKPELSLKGHEF